ncbi:MAG TPA: uracil-DNA glycosylase [Anaerolineales bacterium]
MPLSIPPLPPSWRSVIGEEPEKPYYQKLSQFIARERERYTIYPPEPEIFSALQITSYDHVNVLLLGQDPYHDNNQAHGLCFSVRPGIPPPPSLVNIFKELHDDVGFQIPNNGYLVPWAEQGILMLNAVLTVRAHQPNSHQGKGWEIFTDTIIRAVSAKSSPVVFILWGGYAKKKAQLIDTHRHVIIHSAHPSPLSVRRGFFGSRPFSKTNAALRAAGKPEINWQIPDL